MPVSGRRTPRGRATWTAETGAFLQAANARERCRAAAGLSHRCTARITRRLRERISVTRCVTAATAGVVRQIGQTASRCPASHHHSTWTATSKQTGHLPRTRTTCSWPLGWFPMHARLHLTAAWQTLVPFCSLPVNTTPTTLPAPSLPHAHCTPPALSRLRIRAALPHPRLPGTYFRRAGSVPSGKTPPGFAHTHINMLFGTRRPPTLHTASACHLSWFLPLPCLTPPASFTMVCRAGGWALPCFGMDMRGSATVAPKTGKGLHLGLTCHPYV